MYLKEILYMKDIEHSILYESHPPEYDQSDMSI